MDMNQVSAILASINGGAGNTATMGGLGSAMGGQGVNPTATGIANAQANAGQGGRPMPGAVPDRVRALADFIRSGRGGNPQPMPPQVPPGMRMQAPMGGTPMPTPAPGVRLQPTGFGGGNVRGPGYS